MLNELPFFVSSTTRKKLYKHIQKNEKLLTQLHGKKVYPNTSQKDIMRLCIEQVIATGIENTNHSNILKNEGGLILVKALESINAEKTFVTFINAAVAQLYKSPNLVNDLKKSGIINFVALAHNSINESYKESQKQKSKKKC